MFAQHPPWQEIHGLEPASARSVGAPYLPWPDFARGTRADRASDFVRVGVLR